MRRIGAVPGDSGLGSGRTEYKATPALPGRYFATDPSGRIGHWILKVHLVDRAREIGGFYEELLSL